MRLVALSFLSVLLTACSVNIRMPVNRFDSPEVIGQPGVVKTDLGLQGVSEIVLTNDPSSSTAPNVKNPQINSTHRVRVSGTYSISDILDIEYRPPLGASLKAQILGVPYKSAKKGNFSLAASLGYKYAMNQDPDPTSGGGIRMKLNESMLDGAVIGGYRVLDMLMFYGGIFTVSDSYSGSWHDTFNIDSGAHTNGFNLGMELSASGFQSRIEYAIGKTSVENADKTARSLGVNVSYLF